MAEALERTINQFLRRWLGLPQSLSNIALSGHSTKLQLPISSLSEEFKVTRAWEVLMFFSIVIAQISFKLTETDDAITKFNNEN